MMKWLFIFFMVCPLIGWSQIRVESVPVHDTVEVKVGDRVPGFIFRDTAKQKMSLKQFKGKYVVIDVWASWCARCR